MELALTKMHGLGNDYLIVDERQNVQVPESDKSPLARTLCERGFGAGADGVLYLGTPDNADLQMRIFNADGSEAESCGNGLRCAAFYHHGPRKPGTSSLSINLPLAGVVEAEVNRGRPGLADVRLELEEAGRYEGEQSLEVAGLALSYHRVDVGNPHAVFFLEENSHALGDLDELDLTDLGPPIQAHPDFEETGGINAEFVIPADPEETGSSNVFRMRVHERGVGETASCGTGCIAVARACAETGRGSGWIEIQQPGGTLRIETDRGFLQGPAEHTYDGYYPYFQLDEGSS